MNDSADGLRMHLLGFFAPDLILIGIVAYFIWQRRTASPGAIKRRLAGVRDSWIRAELIRRIEDPTSFHLPADRHYRITNRGLNVAAQHAETAVREARRLAPKGRAVARILDEARSSLGR